MNKATKIFFGTLFVVVALAVGRSTFGRFAQQRNDIACQPSVSEEPVSAPLDPFSQRKVTAQPQSHGDLLVTTVQPGSALSAASSGFIPLERAAYRLSYNPATRLPVWVAWYLTAEHTDGPYSRKGIKFAEDEDVPVPRATNMDYVNSGYDRGHICPSGDNKWSEEAQLQSFLYTNCCPQLHNLNAGDWNELEGKCRKWAQQYGGVYIVSGPLLLNKKHKTIGKNKVVVPEAFFKVVLCMEVEPKAIGFIYRNEANNKTMSSYVNTVDDVERLTGLDFFSALPDEVEREVEAKADLADWE